MQGGPWGRLQEVKDGGEASREADGAKDGENEHLYVKTSGQMNNKKLDMKMYVI